MQPSIPFETALACEHVVPGIGSKATLIGIFSGNILLAEIPGALWMAFYLELPSAPSPQIENLTLELRLDEEKVAAFEIGQVAASDGASAILIPEGRLKIERPTKMTLMAFASGYKDTVVLSKNISLMKGDEQSPSPPDP